MIYEIRAFGSERYRRLVGPIDLSIEELMHEFNKIATHNDKTHAGFCLWLVQSKGFSNALIETHFYSPEA